MTALDSVDGVEGVLLSTGPEEGSAVGSAAGSTAGSEVGVDTATHTARDDHGQPEGPVVGLHEELGRCLGRRVRVGGLEDVVLDHGRRLHGLALAVDLVCRDVDEANHIVHLGRFQQHVRAEDVVPRELERVAERVVDVRLRREVHDRVDLLRLQNVVDEVRRADVALDEFVVRQRRDLLEVREARAVVEAVEVQDLVLRVPARRRRITQLL